MASMASIPTAPRRTLRRIKFRWIKKRALISPVAPHRHIRFFNNQAASQWQVLAVFLFSRASVLLGIGQ
jgi:hypothetical protein